MLQNHTYKPLGRTLGRNGNSEQSVRSDEEGRPLSWLAFLGAQRDRRCGMILNSPVLPDSIAGLFCILGAIAVGVYIRYSIADMKTVRHENRIREFRAAVKTNKTSQTLADYYTAAAYGDPDDCDYWTETARQFKGDKNNGRSL